MTYPHSDNRGNQLTPPVTPPYPQGPMPQQFPAQTYGPGMVPPHPYAGQVQRPGNGLGTAGFVLGLLGLVLCWVPFVGIVCGLLGVVLGGAGMSTGRRTGAGTGLAVAGLVMGIVSLVPAIIVIAALSTV